MLPGSRAGPRMLLSRTAAVLYQKDIPLSLPHLKKYHKKKPTSNNCWGKEAVSVRNRQGDDDGVKIRSE